MFIKTTEELNRILERTPLEDIDQYLQEEETEITLKQYFQYYLEKNQLTKADLIKRSTLDRSYGYQILNGLRKGGRDKILSLCLAGEMPLKEIQRVLSIAGERILYPRDSRDAVILSCVHHSLYNLDKINSTLYEHGFEPIK